MGGGPEAVEMNSGRKALASFSATTGLARVNGWLRRPIRGSSEELYQRLAQLGEHFAKVGKNLLGATKAYNQAVGSLESRVMVSARKFEDLQVSTSADGLPPLQQVEQGEKLFRLG